MYHATPPSAAAPMPAYRMVFDFGAGGVVSVEYLRKAFVRKATRVLAAAAGAGTAALRSDALRAAKDMAATEVVVGVQVANFFVLLGVSPYDKHEQRGRCRSDAHIRQNGLSSPASRALTKGRLALTRAIRDVPRRSAMWCVRRCRQ